MAKTILEKWGGVLVVVRCWCGIQHAIPQSLSDTADNDRDRVVYCPLGHQWVRNSNTRAARLERELQRERAAADQIRADRDRYQRQAEHEDRRRRAIKGQLTKTRKRIAAGACPCCHQKFSDLEKHIEKNHPHYKTL